MSACLELLKSQMQHTLPSETYRVYKVLGQIPGVSPHQNKKKKSSHQSMPANSLGGKAQQRVHLRQLDFYKWRQSKPLVYSAQIQN